MPLFEKVQQRGDWATCGDAAYANGLDGTAFDAVGGYLHSPNAYHPWSEQDWFAILGPKLPIYVATLDGKADAENALSELQGLGVEFRKGIYIAYDLETRVDKTAVAGFGAIMQHYGFKVLVYGSSSSVFENPQLNGYWVADYAGIGEFMYSHMGTRMTQWTDGEHYDQSTVKRWILPGFWR